MFHAADRVLVGVMNNPQDFEITRDEGWYRIPKQHAPECTTDAAVLAFYFTAAFKEQKWAIRWYAEVRGYELARRVDLLPREPEHPSANKPYYKLQIGPLIERNPPIPSMHWRRITFITTTWDRFNAAEEINDLYISGADGLYVTLKESGFFPEKTFIIRQNKEEYTADLAIPCQNGIVGITLDDQPAPTGILRNPDLATIQSAVAKMGGAIKT
ncbi:MAG: hypothetical protein JW981_04225 [Anaerolineae bacterium]|nr:hypothetical protein [Anaerolineae bacterium]